MPLRLQRVIAVCIAGGFILSHLSDTSARDTRQVPSSSLASDSTSTGIQAGFKQERELQGSEKHTYPLRLKAGDYLKLTVEQKGIDVVVRLLGPDGKIVQEVDRPNGTQGPEPLSLIVEQAGSYTLEVASSGKTAEPGKYELKLEALHLATDQDRARLEIEVLVAKVEQLERAGKYNDALPLATQALEKSEQAFGQEHPLVATCLNNLASVYDNQGKYKQAVSLYERAIAVREKVLGPDHPATAGSINDLAVTYHKQGANAQAESLYLRALASNEKSLGAEHPNTASVLSSLASLYHRQGQYTKAESFLLRAIAIREKVLGPFHPATGNSLNNLASLYESLGLYAKAEALYGRVVAINEKSLGPEHPGLAITLNNLAALYTNQGQYARAEQMYMRALAIREKTLGTEHPAMALALNNLAAVYYSQGQLEKAEGLYVRALAIGEKVLGAQHLDTSQLLTTLALCYLNQKQYTKTEPLLVRAIAIREKELGPENQAVAYPLSHLALLYKYQGQYEKAEPLFVRSLAIYEKALGSEHPLTAVALSNLALFYGSQGQNVKAEPLLVRALAIREKALGLEHPHTVAILGYLARFYWLKGDTVQAIGYQTRANDSSERDLVRNLVAGSENQKALYLKQTELRTDLTLPLQVQSAPQNQEALRMALLFILRRKGRALDAMTSAIATLRNQNDPTTQKLLDDYASLAGQISVLTLRGPGKKKPEAHLADLHELENRKEILEAEISNRSAEFKSQVTPITLEEVQKLIPPNASLVEYAVYRPFDTNTGKYGAPRYVAYVLKNPPSRPGVTPNPEIQFADLGEAEPIYKVVAAFRRVASNQASADNWSRKLSLSTQAAGGNSTQANVKVVGHQLEKLIFEPVRKLIGTSNHLLISPDGDLNLIPFSALTDERGQYLVEKYTLTYLTSGRDLLRFNVKLASEEPPLVLADPDYAFGIGPVVGGQSLKRLLPLPATAREGQTIQKLLEDARLVVKTEATEKAIKAVRRPSLLHVATHGYFLTDTPRETPLDPTRNLSDTPVINAEQLRIENPLLRSWLFFAGANRGGSNDNDGIMTALEAAQLNLWGTKLVTLSACETGVGEAKTGDGVYGLRRALVLAGSEAQLMSLWSVSDQATRKLMVDYYTRLKAGEGRSAALRNVQLDMLKDPRRQHPFYWASFIQSGEWASLDGKR